MGNKCSACCRCSCCTNGKTHGHISSAGSVYSPRKCDDLPIEKSERYRIAQNRNAIQLALDHVQREDSGHYTLFAKTKMGTITRKDIELVAEDRSSGDDPPTFLRRLSDLSVKVGTRTRLLVEIRSSSSVKVTWFRNDRRICENNRIRCVNEGNFYCVEITPVSLDDGGRWMCMVENANGRNSCLAILNVLVPKAYKAPEFVEHLRALLTEQGTVSLECKVIGVPTPFLRWFKDSKEIKAGDVFALTANPDDPTSLGTYTCEATNCMGRTYSSSKVHVVGRGSREGSLKPADNVQNNGTPPIFTEELKNVKIKLGDTITLGCQVIVPPWPKSVVWYNKEGRVESNENIRIIEDGLGMYMIEVKQSNSSDEGEWKCVVTSIDGSVGISTCNVEMDIPKNYRKPRFMENLKAVLTDEGLVSFECKVVGFPTPQLKWFKDDQELKPGDVYQLTGTNSLGTYCCVAKNCMGQTSSTAILTVEDIQDKLNDEERLVYSQKQNQPPKFIQGLKSQEAKINEDFRFFIEVSATPEPKLSWYRDELPIEDSDRYVILRETAANCQLSIRKVEFVDQAEWKCVATNDYGTSVTSCFLKLQIPRHYKKPKFLECLRAILTEEGAVNLECKVIGVPQPVLKWYKDGIELKAGDIHRIISGQDGTCCLGTYTCEARNCMGIVASSASILGFDDAAKAPQNVTAHVEALQRNCSLSTINEERSSQLYETPAGDITINEKSEISFSFDGKEVSVSLYETPDLTEEEALQIVEMYADQISEHVTEHNVVELPPLRFVKETSQSGNLLMEAVIIDVVPEYFIQEEDMRTEADLDNVSINEISLHGLTTIDEPNTEDGSSGQSKKNDSVASRELDYFSLSKGTKDGLPNDDDDDDTEDLQTFASARDSDKLHHSMVEDAEQFRNLEDVLSQSGSRKRKVSSSQTDKSAKRQIFETQNIEQNLNTIVPLAKLIGIVEKNLEVINEEVYAQSALMMSPASADGSLAIIQNLLEPIRCIKQKLNDYNGQISTDLLFDEVANTFEMLHQGLTVVEKCVSMDEIGHTMVQRTSVCIIDSVGEEMLQLFNEIDKIADNMPDSTTKSETKTLTNDLRTGIIITQNTIKAHTVLQQANEIEMAQHISDTMERVQNVPESIPFGSLSTKKLPVEAYNFKNVCRSIVRMQEILDTADLNSKPNEILRSLMQPISALENEIQAIESNLNCIQSSEEETLEEKINIILWDTVTPPLYELFKSLEALEVQSPTQARQVCAGILPPLQEIQNGLARIGQDIENGTIGRHSPPIENTDTPRLIENVRQSLIYLESNIQVIKLNDSTRQALASLCEQLTKCIDDVIEFGEENCLTVLGCVKKPIDDLNYCFRQMEERSTSKLIQDILDPLNGLRMSVCKCEEKFQSSNASDKILEILVKLKNEINSTEQSVILEPHLHEAIEDQISSSSNSQRKLESTKSFKNAEPLGDICATIETVNNCIASLQENTQFETATNLKSNNITELATIAQPLQSIRTNLAALQEIVLASNQTSDMAENEQIKLIERLAEPLTHVYESLKFLEVNVNDPLQSIPSEGSLSDLKVLAKPLIEMQECIALIQHESDLGEVVHSLAQEHSLPSAKFAKPMLEIQTNIEQILQQIVNPSEDISTISEISALKTVAEALPHDDDSIYSPNIKEVNVQLAEAIQTNEPLSALSNLCKIQNEISDDRSPAMLEINEMLTAVLGKISESDTADETLIEVTESMHNLQVIVTKATSVETNPLLAELQFSVSEMQKHIFQQTSRLDLIENDRISAQFTELYRCVATMPKSIGLNVIELQKALKIENVTSLKAIEASISELKQCMENSPDCLDVMNELKEENKLVAKLAAKTLLKLKTELESVDTSSLQGLEPNIIELDSSLIPVLDLISCVNAIDCQILEQFENQVTVENFDIKVLEQKVLNAMQQNAMEALNSLSAVTGLETLQALSTPLQELQQHAKELSMEKTSRQGELSTFKQAVKPLLEIKQFMSTSDGQSMMNLSANMSETDDLKTKIRPLLECLNYIDQIERSVLDNLIEESKPSIDSENVIEEVSLDQLNQCLKNAREFGMFQQLEQISLNNDRPALQSLINTLHELNESLQVHVAQSSEMGEQLIRNESMELPESVAKPVVEIKDYMLSIDGHQELIQILEDLSNNEDTTQAEPLFSLLECIDKINPASVAKQTEINELKKTQNIEINAPQEMNQNDEMLFSYLKTIPGLIDSLQATHNKIESIDVSDVVQQLKKIQSFVGTKRLSEIDSLKADEKLTLMESIAEPLKHLKEVTMSFNGFQIIQQKLNNRMLSDQNVTTIQSLVGLCNSVMNMNMNLEPSKSGEMEEFQTKMSFDVQADLDQLICKSKESPLTVDDEDKLNSVLAKINQLDIKIHDTVFDAKIINESTAEIIDQLKEELEYRDELKKNVDLGNVSEKNVDEITKSNEKTPKIDDNKLIGIEQENRTATERVHDDTIENKNKELDKTIDVKHHVELECIVNFVEETTIFEVELNNSLNDLNATLSQIGNEAMQIIGQPITYIQQTLESIKEPNTMDLQTLTYLLSDLKQSLDGCEVTKSIESPYQTNLLSLQRCVNSAIISISDISRPPAEAVMTHLIQPNEILQKCMENVQNCSEVEIISELKAPLNDLKDGIKRLTDSIEVNPLEKISCNTVNIQQFIADLQTIESQLFFVQQNCQKSQQHTALGKAVFSVKNQLANVQNKIQFSEDVHPLLLTKAIYLLSEPLMYLNAVCNDMKDNKPHQEADSSEIASNKTEFENRLEESAAENVQFKNERPEKTEATQETTVKSDTDILRDEFNSSVINLRSSIELTINGHLITLQPYKVLERPLDNVAKIIDQMTKSPEEIQQLANILSDLREKLDTIDPQVLAETNPKIAEIAYGELMSLEKSIIDTLTCVEDLNVTPLEAVIAHLEKPIRMIESCVRLLKRTSKSVPIRGLERPLNELKTSMCILGAFILRDPLLHISRNSIGIQNFITELQHIESQLYFKQSELAQLQSVPFHAELSDSVSMVKLQITDIQNEIQYAETTHPILITKVMDKLCKPLEIVNMVVENIMKMMGDDVAVKDEAPFELEQEIAKAMSPQQEIPEPFVALEKEREIMSSNQLEGELRTESTSTDAEVIKMGLTNESSEEITIQSKELERCSIETKQQTAMISIDEELGTAEAQMGVSVEPQVIQIVNETESQQEIDVDYSKLEGIASKTEKDIANFSFVAELEASYPQHEASNESEISQTIYNDETQQDIELKHAQEIEISQTQETSESSVTVRETENASESKVDIELVKFSEPEAIQKATTEEAQPEVELLLVQEVESDTHHDVQMKQAQQLEVNQAQGTSESNVTVKETGNTNASKFDSELVELSESETIQIAKIEEIQQEIELKRAQKGETETHRDIDLKQAEGLEIRQAQETSEANILVLEMENASESKTVSELIELSDSEVIQIATIEEEPQHEVKLKQVQEEELKTQQEIELKEAQELEISQAQEASESNFILKEMESASESKIAIELVELSEPETTQLATIEEPQNEEVKSATQHDIELEQSQLLEMSQVQETSKSPLTVQETKNANASKVDSESVKLNVTEAIHIATIKEKPQNEVGLKQVQEVESETKQNIEILKHAEEAETSQAQETSELNLVVQEMENASESKEFTELVELSEPETTRIAKIQETQNDEVKSEIQHYIELKQAQELENIESRETTESIVTVQETENVKGSKVDSEMVDLSEPEAIQIATIEEEPKHNVELDQVQEVELETKQDIEIKHAREAELSQTQETSESNVIVKETENACELVELSEPESTQIATIEETQHDEVKSETQHDIELKQAQKLEISQIKETSEMTLTVQETENANASKVDSEMVELNEPEAMQIATFEEEPQHEVGLKQVQVEELETQQDIELKQAQELEISQTQETTESNAIVKKMESASESKETIELVELNEPETTQIATIEETQHGEVKLVTQHDIELKQAQELEITQVQETSESTLTVQKIKNANASKVDFELVELNEPEAIQIATIEEEPQHEVKLNQVQEDELETKEDIKIKHAQEAEISQAQEASESTVTVQENENASESKVTSELVELSEPEVIQIATIEKESQHEVELQQVQELEMSQAQETSKSNVIVKEMESTSESKVAIEIVELSEPETTQIVEETQHNVELKQCQELEITQVQELSESTLTVQETENADESIVHSESVEFNEPEAIQIATIEEEPQHEVKLKQVQEDKLETKEDIKIKHAQEAKISQVQEASESTATVQETKNASESNVASELVELSEPEVIQTATIEKESQHEVESMQVQVDSESQHDIELKQAQELKISEAQESTSDRTQTKNDDSSDQSKFSSSIVSKSLNISQLLTSCLKLIKNLPKASCIYLKSSDLDACTLVERAFGGLEQCFLNIQNGKCNIDKVHDHFDHLLSENKSAMRKIISICLREKASYEILEVLRTMKEINSLCVNLHSETDSYSRQREDVIEQHLSTLFECLQNVNVLLGVLSGITPMINMPEELCLDEPKESPKATDVSTESNQESELLQIRETRSEIAVFHVQEATESEVTQQFQISSDLSISSPEQEKSICGESFDVLCNFQEVQVDLVEAKVAEPVERKMKKKRRSSKQSADFDEEKQKFKIEKPRDTQKDFELEQQPKPIQDKYIPIEAEESYNVQNIKETTEPKLGDILHIPTQQTIVNSELVKSTDIFEPQQNEQLKESVNVEISQNKTGEETLSEREQPETEKSIQNENITKQKSGESVQESFSVSTQECLKIIGPPEKLETVDQTENEEMTKPDNSEIIVEQSGQKPVKVVQSESKVEEQSIESTQEIPQAKPGKQKRKSSIPVSRRRKSKDKKLDEMLCDKGDTAAESPKCDVDSIDFPTKQSVNESKQIKQESIQKEIGDEKAIISEIDTHHKSLEMELSKEEHSALESQRAQTNVIKILENDKIISDKQNEGCSVISPEIQSKNEIELREIPSSKQKTKDQTESMNEHVELDCDEKISKNITPEITEKDLKSHDQKPCKKPETPSEQRAVEEKRVDDKHRSEEKQTENTQMNRTLDEKMEKVLQKGEYECGKIEPGVKDDSLVVDNEQLIKKDEVQEKHVAKDYDENLSKTKHKTQEKAEKDSKTHDRKPYEELTVPSEQRDVQEETAGDKNKSEEKQSEITQMDQTLDEKMNKVSQKVKIESEQIEKGIKDDTLQVDNEQFSEELPKQDKTKNHTEVVQKLAEKTKSLGVENSARPSHEDSEIKTKKTEDGKRGVAKLESTTKTDEATSKTDNAKKLKRERKKSHDKQIDDEMLEKPRRRSSAKKREEAAQQQIRNESENSKTTLENGQISAEPQISRKQSAKKEIEKLAMDENVTPETKSTNDIRKEKSVSPPVPQRRQRRKLSVESRPKIETQLNNMTIANGSSTKLICNYSGSNVNVQWLKDDKMLSPNEKYNLHTEQDGITSLRINGLTPNDSGTYKCILSNSYGDCDTMATITVSEPPPIEIRRMRRRSSASIKNETNQAYEIKSEVERQLDKGIMRKPIIETKLRNRTIDLNSNVQLMCSFMGDDYEIKWEKDGAIITTDGIKYKTSESDGFAYLNIMQTEKNDCGAYKCVVSNKKGIAQSICELKSFDDGTMETVNRQKSRKDQLNYLKSLDITTPSAALIIMGRLKGKLIKLSLNWHTEMISTEIESERI